MDSDSVEDMKEIRRRARPHIERGAVTDGCAAGRESVIELLNHAFATEIVRVPHDSFRAVGLRGEPVAREFRERAAEERGHAERVAVDSCLGMIRYVGDSDPTTRRRLDDIPADEKEQAQKPGDLLAALDPAEKRAGTSTPLDR